MTVMDNTHLLSPGNTVHVALPETGVDLDTTGPFLFINNT